MIADLETDRIVVRDVPLRLNTVVQKVMGARHVRHTDDWSFPASWVSLHQLVREMGRGNLEVSDSLRDWSTAELDRVSSLHTLQVAQEWPGNSDLAPLQRVGAQFLLTAERAILGDDMGAGKTVMTCDALISTDSRAILIACPKTVMSVWEEHVTHWTRDITPLVASDSSVKRRKTIAEAVKLVKAGRRVALIMNYESVWRHTRLSPYGNLRMEKCERCDPHGAAPVQPAKCETCDKELNDIQWDTVICDEAHRVINVTKQTRGIWHLSKEADRVWALTGTPTRGSVADFWSLLRLVDPTSWPSKSKFIDRYCQSYPDSWGNLIVSGVRNEMRDEFEQVTGQYMLRRTYEQIKKSWADWRGEEYRATTRIAEERRVELTTAQRSLYRDIADRMFVTLDNGNVVWADNALEELTRLLQVSAAMIDVDEDGKVRMVAPSPKIKELLEVLKDVGDKSVVVFAVNRDLVELARVALEKEGYRTATVHGGVASADRTMEIERFQHGDADVFLGTYAAASEGITLTRAHVMVCLQRSWSMILNQQANRRIDRIGQESDTIVIVDVIADDTVESRVHEAYGDKLDALEAIVQDARRMKELVG